MLDLDPKLNALAERVIGAAIKVHRQLGAGFQEVTYAKTLAVELELRGIAFRTEVPVRLSYKQRVIGQGRLDFLVEDCLVLELKSIEGRATIFKRQVVAYLKATGHQLGLIINFHVDVLRDGIIRIIQSDPHQ